MDGLLTRKAGFLGMDQSSLELSPRLCPQQAPSGYLWVLGKTETLPCPWSQVKGALAWLRLETEETRDGLWAASGALLLSYACLCPTHQGVEGKLGVTGLTKRSHVISHTQTDMQRSGSTFLHKERFFGRN